MVGVHCRSVAVASDLRWRDYCSISSLPSGSQAEAAELDWTVVFTDILLAGIGHFFSSFP